MMGAKGASSGNNENKQVFGRRIEIGRSRSIPSEVSRTMRNSFIVCNLETIRGSPLI